MRRLPSLGALRAFEAAARHGSFKRAAAELGVTPTAISHQVRQLEDDLRVALFDRQVRKVVLTADGDALYPALQRAFDTMAESVAAVRQRPLRRVATLSATVAFTAKLLVPHVARSGRFTRGGICGFTPPTTRSTCTPAKPTPRSAMVRADTQA